jgi:kinesin family protein 6/9
MIGDAQSYEHRGIAPRAISQLFSEINSRVELEFLVSCTYMEIYNERIYDLLVDLSRPEQAGEYTIVEEKDGRGIFVRGLTEIEVRDETSALNLLFTGGLSRTTATHKLNKRSNRSHSIFTLYVQQRQRSGVSERITHSKLHLVDLAGSERLKKTMDSIDGSMGDEVTRKESMAINRSLTYLEQCVVALTRKGAAGGAGHVPYRQSKLTNILKDCLGANCNTVMVACVWGESSHLEETISTLRLASRMMKVQNESVSVESIDPSILLKKQENIIKALKQELLMHDALVERTGVVYDAYTPEQQQEMSQLIEKYVATPEKDEDNILQIQSYRQMLEICKQFKKKLIEARSSSRNNAGSTTMFNDSTDDLYKSDAKGLGASNNLNSTNGEKLSLKEVGNVSNNGRGFALGEARMDSRPPNGIETSASFYAASPKPSVGGGPNGANPGNFSPIPTNRSDKAGRDASPLGRGAGSNSNFMIAANDLQSFEGFIKNSVNGQQLFGQFTSLKNSIKDMKSKIRYLTTEVNDTKVRIDELNVALENQKASRIQFVNNKQRSNQGRGGRADEIVDEEEIMLAKSLKEKKQSYRNAYEQLQKTQFQLTTVSNEMNEVKSKMMESFNLWQQTSGGTGGYGNTGSFQDVWDNSSPVEDRNFGFTNTGGGAAGAIDELDDQEAFDKLEAERVLSNDPESLAFFMAQKTRRANLTQAGGTIRMIQRNKRNN